MHYGQIRPPVRRCDLRGCRHAGWGELLIRASHDADGCVGVLQGGAADDPRDRARRDRVLVGAGLHCRGRRRTPARRLLREPRRSPHRRRTAL